MPLALYFGIGCFIALAALVSVYSLFGALLCLLCAYAAFRFGRNDGNEELLIPDLDEVRGRIKPMEVLQESDDELMIRGSERILIINRKKKSISGIHSILTTFSKIRHIIDQAR